MKKIICCIMACLATMGVRSQVASGSNNFIPKSPTEGLSPTAKSFYRYGDVPVSLYTGTPDINIPLAELKEGHLSLPISLSYHSGGVKVNDHPGWTGLGWTLAAGGVISRETRDVPDEIPKQGYKDLGKILNLDNATPQQAVNIAYSTVNTLYYSSAGDTEPDKFYFQMPGYSGYFMLNSEGEWLVYCDRPIKVSAEIERNPAVTFPNGKKTRVTQLPMYRRFVLTGDDGTTYTFGSTAPNSSSGFEAVELSISSTSQSSSYWSSSAWHLVEIRSVYGDVVTFDYERGDFVVNFSDEFHNARILNSSYGIAISQESGSLISPVYISEIKSSTFDVKLNSSKSIELDYTGEQYRKRSNKDTPDVDHTVYCPSSGQVSFHDEVNWRKLDEICFHTYENRQYKRIVFDYSSDAQQRLTLNGVDFYDFGPDVAEKYRFIYNDVKKLPAYLSGYVDHWGFYSISDTQPTSQNYRDPNPPSVPYGTLREIVYPTGGRTLLEFEPHSYTRIAGFENDIIDKDAETIAGGYRIRRRINIPADSMLPEVREYVYSDGMLEGEPIHSHTTSYDLGNQSFKLYESYSVPLSSKMNSSGNHICYPTVIERCSDGSTTTTTFLSPADGGYANEVPMAASDLHSFGTRSMKSQYRGKTKSIAVADRDGHTICRTDIDYIAVGDPGKYAAALFADWFTVPDAYNSEHEISFPQYSFYRNYTHSILESARTDRTYSRGGAKASETVRYRRYNAQRQLEADSIVAKYADGRTDIDLTLYSYQWQKDATCKYLSIFNLISDVKYSHNGTAIKTIECDYTFSNYGFPQLTSVSELFGGNARQKLYECLLYDSRGLPVHTVDDTGLHHIYLWGHDRLLPVAEITNADVAAVQTVLGYDVKDLPNDENFAEKMTALRQQCPAAMVTTYAYTPFLGVTAITDPSGRTSRFEYDLQKRLTAVRNNANEVVTRYFYNTWSGHSTGPDVVNMGIATP